LRLKLAEYADAHGNEALHALLRDKDPESWNSLHPNDRKRVIRALEYFAATGTPILGA